MQQRRKLQRKVEVRRPSEQTMEPHNLLILTVSDSVDPKKMVTLAVKSGDPYNAQYGGKSKGLGKLDVLLKFSRKTNLEQTLNRMYQIITESNEYPKSISYTIRDTRKPLKDAITGQVIAGKEVSVKKQRRG